MGILIKTTEGAPFATVKLWQPGGEYDCKKNITFQVPIDILPSYVLCQLMTERMAEEVQIDHVIDIFDFFYDKMKLVKVYMEKRASERAEPKEDRNV